LHPNRRPTGKKNDIAVVPKSTKTTTRIRRTNARPEQRPSTRARENPDKNGSKERSKHNKPLKRKKKPNEYHGKTTRQHRERHRPESNEQAQQNECEHHGGHEKHEASGQKKKHET
jgi:hypothetical protein